MKSSEQNVDLRKSLVERRMVELTPILAKHYLGFNNYSSQRTIKKPHVAELAKKMTNGLFRYGEVAFVSINGGKDIQVDGQHICHAVIESEKTVPCIFEKFNVKNEQELSEVFRQFEILPKSLTEHIAIEAASLKIAWPIRISSLIVTAAVMEVAGQKNLNSLTGMTTYAQTNWMSRDDKVKLLCKYMKEGAFVADILTFNQTQKAPIGTEHLRRAAVVFIMMKTWRIDQNDAKLFWTRIRDGERLDKNMPEMKIRNFLFLTRLTVRTSAYIARNATKHEYAYRCALAWNAFRLDKPTNLAYHPSRRIPELK